MVGTLGGKIIFTVSSDAVLTFKDLKREVKGRWTVHDILGGKPKAEFLGPDVQSLSFTIHLDMNLHIAPALVLDAIYAMVESGDAEYLIIGYLPVGTNPWRIVSASTDWNATYHSGVLMAADVTLELGEYE